MYNDLDGSDNNFVVRNILLAGFYVLCSSGALRVACGPFTLNQEAFQWLAIIAGVIITTMHIQDLKDQKGNRAQEEKTLRIALGDWVARRVIATLVLIWSVVGPAFWSIGA